jgi:hypothetical protein
VNTILGRQLSLPRFYLKLHLKFNVPTLRFYWE